MPEISRFFGIVIAIQNCKIGGQVLNYNNSDNSDNSRLDPYDATYDAYDDDPCDDSCDPCGIVLPHQNQSYWWGKKPHPTSYLLFLTGRVFTTQRTKSDIPCTSRITALGLMLPALFIFCCLAGGSLSFGSEPSHTLHSPAHQAASPKHGSLASPEKAENADIVPTVAISYPPAERLFTPYRQIFLEGKIRAKNGIRRIELNGQELFNGMEIEAIFQKNWPKINRGNQDNQSNQELARQSQDLSRGKGMSKIYGPSKGQGLSKVKTQSKAQDLAKMRQTLKSNLEKYNLYYLNQICTLKEGDNRLNLVVEDNLGHKATKSLDIRSAPQVKDTQVKDSHQSHTDARELDVRAIPPKENSESSENPGIPESRHRMILALIPPTKKAGTPGIAPAVHAAQGTAPAAGGAPVAGTGSTGSDDFSDYIYHRLTESFTRQGRFQLVERSKLPCLLIEKAIQTKDISQQEFTRQLSHLTPAEGVIFVDVQKRDNGLEIVARLVDMKSATLVFHRVFAPVREPKGHQAFEELNTIISGLAMKFRDSFPLLTGAVMAREGPIIQVDLGSEKGIFRGIWYNIMRGDGREVICRAVVEEVAKGTSRARVIEEEKSREIRQGCRVSTR